MTSLSFQNTKIPPIFGDNPYAPSKPRHETKVVVAMSGGVDSSTVAALLASEGYQVIGITLQLYDLAISLEKKGACCAGKDIYDAKEVCDQIGVPHYVLNYESLFKQAVMDEFADSYLRGETPIPCVKCNQSVKFRDLFKVAKDLGADALATGHYVQRTLDEAGQPVLYRGADKFKDQSYFLFATTREQLDFLHFPLGGMSKEETRALAEKFGLLVADKPDSQDICFVPDGDYTKVIKRLRPHALEKGEIVHLETGKVLGQHEGIIHFTIGQRRGLGVAWSDPLYVVKIDPETRRVYVGAKESLTSREVWVKDLNWIGSNPIPSEGVEVTVKLRSLHKPIPATIYPTDAEGVTKILLHDAQNAITPGQACVAYLEDQVLGGGWILRR